MFCLRSVFALAIVLLPAPALPAADDAKGITLFEAKVRPVLATHCYRCHSGEAGKAESGLMLDSRERLRTGGDRGPAIVPGDPKASLLLTAISHADPDLMMPPKQDRLAASVIKDIEEWIRMGAPDPRVVETKPRPPVDIEAGRKFWSFVKPVEHPLPKTKDPGWAGWAKRELDHFILAKLQDKGIPPSPDAEPATLLRRLHFDLVGLPPKPVAVKEFVERIEADGLDQALAAAVDELLASPRFGERWGRHWLDVARYAESSGKESNISFPYAFRYRDYVIDCVNADVPYDRFITEQIAGDLLPCSDDKERARLLIATGFLAIGPKNLDEGNALQFAADVVDEQIDTLTRAVMGMSVACARCHDHKFDPFAMEDYYSLAGVFASTKTYFGTAVSPSNRTAGDPLPLPLGADEPIFHESIPAAQVTKLKDELAAMKKEKVTSLRDALRIFWRSGAIEGQLEKVDENGKALPLAMGVLEREKMVDCPLLDRGEVARPGKIMPRAFPRVIQLPEAPTLPSAHSGRLELARWLTHPDHPLTARVMANRAWRHLFGAGIVATPDNFGIGGDAPTHPELLDHLALKFVSGGWSVKKLVREIVLSRTYRQTSDYRPAAFQADPDNHLVWRVSKRRLDAEAIRDAMLAVSGELDLKRPEGSLVAKMIGDRPISLIGLDSRLPADLDGVKHRSVYLPVLRDRLPDVLDLFDFAEPSLVSGDRETTNVPVQALYLMNSPFVQERAKGLAQRVEKETQDEKQFIRRAFHLCFGRGPDPEENRLAQEFLAKGGDEDKQQVLISYCQALLSTAEFRNLD